MSNRAEQRAAEFMRETHYHPRIHDVATLLRKMRQEWIDSEGLVRLAEVHRVIWVVGGGAAYAHPLVKGTLE